MLDLEEGRWDPPRAVDCIDHRWSESPIILSGIESMGFSDTHRYSRTGADAGSGDHDNSLLAEKPGNAIKVVVIVTSDFTHWYCGARMVFWR